MSLKESDGCHLLPHVFIRMTGHRIMRKLLSDVWCNLMQEQPMCPDHRRYECHTRGRQYSAAWAEPKARQQQQLVARDLSVRRRPSHDNQRRTIMWVTHPLALFVVLSLTSFMILDRPGARK
jgi:hypothetical protein